MHPIVRIEASVLTLYDSVKSGRRVEDGLVELKAAWPDPQKAARRLAGHANAARGESILWVVGLDESDGVQPLAAVDVVEWWSQVQSYFDGAVPTLIDVVVHTEEGPVQALSFDTTLSPFVVKNPTYGLSGAGPVQREVPWRDGTGVRSATRSDLIRLLVPVASLPAVEVLSATAQLRAKSLPVGSGSSSDPSASEDSLNWFFRLELYVTPEVGTVVVFPSHRTSLEFAPGDRAFTPAAAASARYNAPSVSTFGRPGYAGHRLEYVPDTVSVDATSSEAVVHLPGRLFCSVQHSEPGREIPVETALRLRYSVHPAHSERSIQLEQVLLPAPPSRDGALNWTFDA